MAEQLTISDYSECWYVPGSLSIVDVIHPGTGLTLHYKKDEAAVHETNPGAKRMPFDEACKLISAEEAKRFIKPVSEVREADFMYALEVLPPGDWKSRRGVESFKMIERTCGDLTAIFAQCGKRYFTMTDRYSLSAEDIADRVGDYIAEHPVAEPKEYFTL
jgi:hypothetical protein